MPRTFILIPGRSSRQGVTLNEGKYTDGYLDETSTLRMHPDDMRDVGVVTGDEVRMWNEVGSVTVAVLDAKDECPPGLVFICYGDKSSQLMGGETHGTGMPDSKGLDVHLESVANPAASVATAAEDETAAGASPASSTNETLGYDLEAVDSPPPTDETGAARVAASRSQTNQTTVSKSKPASSNSSVSSKLPGSAAKKTVSKKPAERGSGTASKAQIFTIVVGLIIVLVLLLTSGQ